MIPSITGDAASWKYNCHAVDESKNWKKTINKIKKKLKYITKKKLEIIGLEPILFCVQYKRFTN